MDKQLSPQTGDQDQELLFLVPPSPSHSLFEFDDSVPDFPLQRTLHHHDTTLDKNISLSNGIALIVGVSIGSGIFASPGPVLEYSQSVGASLIIWLVAGMLAMAGYIINNLQYSGLCYAELGSMIPHSGGEYPYIKQAYGGLPAFLFSWSGILATRPGSIAIIISICSEYIAKLLDSHFKTPTSTIAVKFISIITIIILTTLNITSSSLAQKTQTILTVLKIFALVLIALTAVVHGNSNDNFKDIFAHSSENPGNYALALFSALWVLGLSDCVGELKDPSKNLPRSIVSGVFLVIGSYLITNIAYFLVLPKYVVATSTTIGTCFGEETLGQLGGMIINGVVILSTIGAANATILTGSRVTFVSAQEGHAPKVLSSIFSKTRTPINALILQSVLAIVAVFIGDFKVLVNLFGMISWTFYLLCVVGLLVLRITEPYTPRPFKVWIGTPILFIITAIGLLGFSIWEAPKEAYMSVLLVGSGIPVYLIGFYSNRSFEELLELMTHYIRYLFNVDRIIGLSSLVNRGFYRQQEDDEPNLEMSSFVE
ncbi:amino acid permease-domain-containing protein [Globomyces pollinis-pini]|nr:amino acid permease-domain-containing protein [Globomyces pollinis-pini]